MEDNIDWLFNDPLPTVEFVDSKYDLKTGVKCEAGYEDQLHDGTGVKAESTVKEEVQVKVEREDKSYEVQSLCLSSPADCGACVLKCGRAEGSSEGDWTRTEEEEYKRRLQSQHCLLSYDSVGRLPEHGFGGVGSLGPAHGEQCMEWVGGCKQEQAVDKPASCGRDVECPMVKVEGGGVSVCEREEGEGSHEEWEDTVQPQVYIEVKTESCEETGVERLGEGEEQEVEGGVHLQARAESSVATGVRWSVCGVQWSEDSSAPVASSSSSCGVSEPGPCVSCVRTAQLFPLEEKRRSRSGQQPSGKRGRVETAGSDVPQDQKSLQAHIADSHGHVRKYACPHCRYRSIREKNLKQHIEIVHEGLRKHPCPHCQYIASQKGKLKRHIDTVHEGLRKHPCPHCQYRASQKGNLEKHIETVHEGLRKHPCPHCQYRAGEKGTLKKHIDTVHEGLRKHPCPHCQYRAGEKRNLKRHIDTVHEGLRKHPCPHCQYRAGEKGNLKKHIGTVHEGIRKYQCPQCPYKAGASKDLKSHLATVHEGLRNYPCPQCEYGAGTKRCLQDHISAVHESIKNYPCPHCKYKGARRTHLSRHLKTVHKNQGK